MSDHLISPLSSLTNESSSMCFNTPVMAGQALSAQDDVTTTTAILMFFQTLGGAIWIVSSPVPTAIRLSVRLLTHSQSVAESAFNNSLLKALPIHAPTVDVQSVIDAGASGFRALFTAEEVPGIVDSYMIALRVTFIIAIAMAGAGALVSPLFPWVSIKGKAAAVAA